MAGALPPNYYFEFPKNTHESPFSPIGSQYNTELLEENQCGSALHSEVLC